MRFWDSSALVPLVVEQPSSAACRSLLRSDARVVAWAFTESEVLGALCRLGREGFLTADGLAAAMGRLDRHGTRWTKVTAYDDVREEAARLLRAYPLTSVDALQLGAALVAFDGRPRLRGFVALDGRLLGAAAAEGFEAVRPR
ncbi:MAG: PIN domain-containing protein [Myxococcales bacterium]|nr:PIN domain-containing protein [Myxococcales bacterium]